MKLKKFVAALLSGVIACGIWALVGCSRSAGKMTFAKALDQSALSGIGLLEYGENLGGVAPLAISQTEQQNVLGNLAIVQNTLKSGIHKTEITTSAIPEYEYNYLLTTKDLSGADRTYEFHYNSVEYKEFTETYEKIDGIVITAENTYEIIGFAEKEINEAEYTFLVRLDSQNFVEMEYEEESGEKEVSYTLYTNGTETYSVELSYEIGRSGKMEYGFSTEVNGVETEYEYTFITINGQEYIGVEIETEIGDRETEQVAYIKVINDNGNITYQFVENVLVS